MAEKKKKNDFGKGLLVGLGVGVAGTCVAAVLMTDDDEPDEIENQVEAQTKESESNTPGFISSVVKAVEAVSENTESVLETDDGDLNNPNN